MRGKVKENLWDQGKKSQDIIIFYPAHIDGRGLKRGERGDQIAPTKGYRSKRQLDKRPTRTAVN